MSRCPGLKSTSASRRSLLVRLSETLSYQFPDGGWTRCPRSRNMFGKQHRHCPNCGKALYDDRMSMDHALSMMCGAVCRKAWELKYARSILGKSADPDSAQDQSGKT